MKITDKRAVLKRIALARKRVNAEISANATNGGRFGAGLANEGWAGGYAQALNDVEAALIHGYPNDPRHYWRNETDD